MTTKTDHLQIAWWAKNIEELDREIARLCLLCEVRILDRGVVERVLRRDASVCATANPLAFAKLHDMLMLYFRVRQKTAQALGELPTESIEARAIGTLRGRFATLLGPWPPV